MSFLAFALALAFPEAPREIPQGQAWCSNKLCDQVRVYDVLPGHEATKTHGAVPDWAFCCFCGDLVDVDLEDEVA